MGVGLRHLEINFRDRINRQLLFEKVSSRMGGSPFPSAAPLPECFILLSETLGGAVLLR